VSSARNRSEMLLGIDSPLNSTMVLLNQVVRPVGTAQSTRRRQNGFPLEASDSNWVRGVAIRHDVLRRRHTP